MAEQPLRIELRPDGPFCVAPDDPFFIQVIEQVRTSPNIICIPNRFRPGIYENFLVVISAGGSYSRQDFWVDLLIEISKLEQYSSIRDDAKKIILNLSDTLVYYNNMIICSQPEKLSEIYDVILNLVSRHNLYDEGISTTIGYLIADGLYLFPICINHNIIEFCKHTDAKKRALCCSVIVDHIYDAIDTEDLENRIYRINSLTDAFILLYSLGVKLPDSLYIEYHRVCPKEENDGYMYIMTLMLAYDQYDADTVYNCQLLGCPCAKKRERMVKNINLLKSRFVKKFYAEGGTHHRRIMEKVEQM